MTFFYEDSPRGDHPQPKPEPEPASPFPPDDNSSLVPVAIEYKDATGFARRIVMYADSEQFFLDAVKAEPSMTALQGEALVAALVKFAPKTAPDDAHLWRIERFGGQKPHNGPERQAAYQTFDRFGDLRSERFMEYGRLVPASPEGGPQVLEHYGDYVSRTYHYNANNRLDDEPNGLPAVINYNSEGVVSATRMKDGDFVAQLSLPGEISILKDQMEAVKLQPLRAQQAEEIGQKFGGKLKVLPRQPRPGLT